MAGQILRRGPKTFIVRAFSGRDGNGKRKYINRTVHGSKKDADKVLVEMLAKRDLGGLAKVERHTVDAHLTNWLDTVVRQRVRQRTYDDYESICKRYLLPHIGSMLISQIGADEIQRLYEKLSKSGLSPRTVRHSHAVFRNAMEIAVRWKLISFNPCDHVDLPKVKRTDMSVLTPEQARRFLEAAKGDRLYAFFSLLLTSGMRPSEALALRWSDIDFDAAIVRIERTLSGRPGRQKFENPKTNRSRRQIPLPSTTILALSEYRERESGGETPADAFGLVFRSNRGLPLDLPNVGKRHFKPILERAGLSKAIRLYDLRHSCATLLLSSGENPKIVAERLGHASIVLTLDTYSHVLPDMQRGASDRLEKLLG